MDIDFKRHREYLTDKALTAYLVLKIVKENYGEIQKSTLRDALKDLALQYNIGTRTVTKNLSIFTFLLNTEVVFDYAASPIEKIFLNSLNIISFPYQNVFIQFGPPTDYSVQGIEWWEGRNERVLKLWRHIFEKLGEGNIEESIAFFEYLKEQGEMTEQQIADLVIAKLLDYVAKMFGLYFVTLQTSFKGIIVDGKTIRADMFIRKPSDTNFKLIVECDGYETHSLKKAFSNDRTRDRLLQMNGFQVFRFSGSDINENPEKMARQLYDYLLEQKVPE